MGVTAKQELKTPHTGSKRRDSSSSSSCGETSASEDSADDVGGNVDAAPPPSASACPPSPSPPSLTSAAGGGAAPSVSVTSVLFAMLRQVILTVLTFVLFFTSFSPLVSDNFHIGFGLSLKVRSAAPATPFFVNSLWVDDYYDGDIYSAFAEANVHRNAFFMFYAPWDADSQYAREILDQVANTFEDNTDLYVAAVNCWTATGDCHADFGAGNKKSNARTRAAVQNQFPIFVFYPKDRRGIQYSGPITISHLLEFIMNCIRPVEVIKTDDDFQKMRALAGGRALLGHFDGLKSWRPSKSYAHFLQVAYDLLEADPFRNQIGRPAVILSPSLAYSLHLNTNQTPLRLLFANGTSLAYPNKTVTSAESLLSWVTTKRAGDSDSLASWTGVSGRKSLRLSQLVEGNKSALFVFTTRALEDVFGIMSGGFIDETMSILRQAGLRYKDCKPEMSRSSVSMSETLTYLRKMSSFELEAEIERCTLDPWFIRSFCKSTASSSESCACCLAFEAGSSPLASNRTLLSSASTTTAFRFHDDMPTASAPNNDKLRFKIHKCRLNPQMDENSHNEIVSWRRLRCSLLSHASSAVCPFVTASSPLVSSANLNEGLSSSSLMFEGIQGLGCADNRSLTLHGVDWGTQRALAESIGLVQEAQEPFPGVVAVIVDARSEVVYVMDSEFSPKTLEEFIYTYHHNPHTLRQLKRSKRVPTTTDRDEKEHESSLSEINTVSFLTTLLKPPSESVDPVYTVLLYTSPSCGFCTAIAHHFHAVQKLLSSERLQFLTIDASRNDLPWHFTALSVPSVLFLGGSKTRAFPSEKALSVPNLVTFIVANLPAELRMQLAVSLCDAHCMRQALSQVDQKVAEGSDDAGHFLQLGDILRTELLRRSRSQAPDSSDRLSDLHNSEEAALFRAMSMGAASSRDEL